MGWCMMAHWVSVADDDAVVGVARKPSSNLLHVHWEAARILVVAAMLTPSVPVWVFVCLFGSLLSVCSVPDSACSKVFLLWRPIEHSRSVSVQPDLHAGDLLANTCRDKVLLHVNEVGHVAVGS